MGRLSTILAIVLGAFELLVVIEMKLKDTPPRLQLFPTEFYDQSATNALLCSFLLFLGLLRIMWACSGRTYMSWLSIVATHIIETVLFWTLALQSHFNKKALVWTAFIFDLVKFQEYDTMSTALLLLVPGLALFFVLNGPQLNDLVQRNSSDKIVTVTATTTKHSKRL